MNAKSNIEIRKNERLACDNVARDEKQCDLNVCTVLFVILVLALFDCI